MYRNFIHLGLEIKCEGNIKSKADPCFIGQRDPPKNIVTDMDKKYYIQTGPDKGFYMETTPEFESYYEKFHTVYQIQGIALAPPEKQKPVTRPRQRICRFCQKTWPAVSFNTDAHIIPESLGNRYLVSEYECDECNAKFGKMDDQLTKFLGVNRSLNGTRGKAKTKHPNYKSADQKVSVRHQPFFGDESAIFIELSESGNGALIRGDSSFSQTIKLVKSPYIPLMAYFALVKMASCRRKRSIIMGR